MLEMPILKVVSFVNQKFKRIRKEQNYQQNCKMYKCLICGRSYYDNANLYSFPQRPDLRNQWLDFCRRIEVPKSARLCEVSEACTYIFDTVL